MARYSHARIDNATFVIIILLGSVAWTHQALLMNITHVALSVVACLLVLRLSWKYMICRRLKSLREVDTMDGLEFERYIAELLRRNSYLSVSLTEKYDFGVDIIATKNGVRWGIQVKRSSRLVKAHAVRQVVTGLKLYNCDQAMVISNGIYSSVAKRLAAANDCLLIDRRGLKQLLQKAKE